MREDRGAGKRKRGEDAILSRSSHEPATVVGEVVEVDAPGKNDKTAIPPRLLYHTYEAGEVEEELREAVAVVAAAMHTKERITIVLSLHKF